VTGQAGIRLVRELHVSFVKGKDIITAKAIHNVCNAKARGNQAISCLARVAEAKDLINNRFFTMDNVGNNIRKSLLKRQDALNGYRARKKAFSLAKEQIIKDIEEAREMWGNTVDQLPDKEFN